MPYDTTLRHFALGPGLPMVVLLVLLLDEVRPHGALVARGGGGDHGPRLHPVAELHRLRAQGGRVVQAAAAVGQVREELGALAEGRAPADGADVFPEDGPAAASSLGGRGGGHRSKDTSETTVMS